MKTTKKLAGRINYAGNDELYPSEVVFIDGCKVCLACSEDGKLYLRVVYD